MSKPLVSVVVVTYNSSPYIIDGLESIRNQNYGNLELIVSDDCSTDNTAEICRDWIEKNRSSFVSAKLVTTEKNTGVSGNLNRGIEASSGDWIKEMAGDDQLLPDSIESYMEFARLNPENDILFGKLRFFGADDKYVDKIRKDYEIRYYPKIKLNPASQRKESLKAQFVPTPGLIYKRSVFDEIGCYDEKYPFCEEDPFIFKLYRAGKSILFCDKELYRYRVDENSLGRGDNSGVKLTRHLKDKFQFFKDVRVKEMMRAGLYLNAYDEYMTFKRIESAGVSKVRTLLYSFLKALSPIYYIKHLKRSLSAN